jgi:hypothetical protein
LAQSSKPSKHSSKSGHIKYVQDPTTGGHSGIVVVVVVVVTGAGVVAALVLLVKEGVEVLAFVLEALELASAVGGTVVVGGSVVVVGAT